MTTLAAAYGSKPSWQIQLDVSESNPDPVNNRSFVSWAEYIYRGNSDTPYNNSGSAFGVSAPGGASGTFGAYRFGGTGSGTNYSATPVGGRVLIASGGDWVTHNPDGSGSIVVSASHAAGATLGSASIGATTITLTTLRQAPGTPTSLVAARVSDSQIDLSWHNNYPSNGAPSSINIQAAINDAAFAAAATLAATETATVSTDANRKTVYRVNAQNSTGTSGWSATATVFTTPAAPTGVTAAKASGGDILIGWTPHVAFVEHEHVVEHSTDGGTTWGALAVVPAGTSSYTHTAPSTGVSHTYQVRARNTDTGALTSAWVQSGTVVLLTAPNKPTVPALGPNVDKGKAFVFPWTHNPVDTTAQTAYEVGYSTNGGSTWSSTGKVTSTTPSRTFPPNSYTSGQQLTLRVRTWGQATTGGSEGTGASPWSDQVTVTFKTRPVATITAPANGVDYGRSALNVVLGFSQVEGATFVSATIELYDGATLLEQKTSTTLAGTALTTRLTDGSTYSVKVAVLDSNGLVSDVATSTFDVDYTEPVAAVVTVTYLPDSGIGQIGLAIPSPGVGEAAAVSVTITRAIGASVEVVVEDYPAAPSLTILDMTPTIVGDNVYTVTTKSADGATTLVIETMTTDEDEWAFLSGGPGLTQIVRFGGELKPNIAPTVDATLVKTSGRARPIGLYAKTGGLVVSGTGEVVTGLGSSPEEIEAFLLLPGRKCYRDPTGRRMFGMVSGSLSRETERLASLAYTVTETS